MTRLPPRSCLTNNPLPYTTRFPSHWQTTLPCKPGKLDRFGFRVVLVHGLNRQVRLIAAHFKYRVKQLFRVRIGNVKLGRLKAGQWRNLTDAELQGLLPQREDW